MNFDSRETPISDGRVTSCRENGLATPKQTSAMLNDAVKTGFAVKKNEPDSARFSHFEVVWIFWTLPGSIPCG